MVHARRLGEDTLDFGHSGRLYRSSFLLYDRGTKSLWHHVTGQALTGRMRGRRLERLPSVFVQWEVWRNTHKDTLVLAKDPDDPRYATDVYRDRNLELKLTWGLGIEVADEHRLYEFSELEKATLVQERVGDVPVVIAYHPPTGTATAWKRTLDGRVLDLRRAPDSDDGRPRLEETGEDRSEFDAVTGRAVAGPLRGKNLEPVPLSHWEVYAWMAHFPTGTTFRASVRPPPELPPLDDE